MSGEHGTNINTSNEGPVSFTIDDGDTLEVGESITLTVGSGTVTGVYQGISDAGDPYFTVSGQYYFGSSTEYTNGASNAPAYTEEAFCFLAGTLIATPEGLVAVEDLAIGDLVLTSEGRTVPVKWMGRQTIVSMFGMSEARRPVVIAAGALGENLPACDLRVTPDHALLLDGALVQAGALVNGTTIRRMTAAELGERFVVYHIELENHELVVAEGVDAETFVDNVARKHFDNYAEFEALFGTSPASIAELDLPRVKSARQLPASIRARVQDAAERLAPARNVAA
ncbi:Hint domain-containing protein [Ancylobacter sp. Lp-2]|uniref:Hint domain-containing protein n=1 Tax=Ancylobacter sp. Lp-2 TaxID=2881339 RepID=UPI001E4303E5|nr:Hint domain-containing protein [Ancylobacter sp. Lp-2]